MADFMTNLWEAVFTPGTTPTLLIATNVTFGALQLVLATLLYLTASIHFAILSLLCGGLWYAINWFAQELRAAQEIENEAKRLRKASGADSSSVSGDATDSRAEKPASGDRDLNRVRDGNGRTRHDDTSEADDEGGETELEASLVLPSVESSTLLPHQVTRGQSRKNLPTFDRESTITADESSQLLSGAGKLSSTAAIGSSTTTTGSTTRTAGGARRRQVEERGGDRRESGHASQVSTDSEWEKVDNER